MSALPDGKFIVVGSRGGKVAAFRLNANGTEDNTFVNQSGMPAGRAVTIAVQEDGKILATVGGGDFSLVRFNADGTLDINFGTGGFTDTDLSGTDYGKRIFIQPDGKYLVGGYSSSTSPARYYFSMARYLGTFAAPNRPLFDYDGDGRADLSVFRASENKWYILRSSNLGITQNVFAVAGDIPTPSDYDGDGKTDIGVFRPSPARGICCRRPPRLARLNGAIRPTFPHRTLSCRESVRD